MKMFGKYFKYAVKCWSFMVVLTWAFVGIANWFEWMNTGVEPTMGNLVKLFESAWEEWITWTKRLTNGK